MIQITKSAKPIILVNNETTWTTELLQAIAAKNAEKIDTISKRYAHLKIKETLEKDFFNKCGYCENTFNATSFGRIDHFCPQNKSIVDTFNWDNLILSCEICNSKKYKSDKFPTNGYEILLIHPCLENPNEHLRFEYNKIDESAFVEIITRKGIETQRTLGLNRPALLIERSKYITTIFALIEKATTNKEAKALLDEYKADSEKFSAFVKTLHKYFDL